MMLADVLLAHGGGCWPCGILTSVFLLGMLAVVLSIPVGIIWLVVLTVRSFRKTRLPE